MSTVAWQSASRSLELDRRSLLLGAGGVAGALALSAPTAAGASLANVSRARLEGVITRSLGSAASRTGVTVVDLRTGVWHSHLGSRQVECASTIKVLIMIAFLRRCRAQGRVPSSYERSQVRAMIRYSDNASATNLRRLAGGAAAMVATAKAAGMTTTARTAGNGSWGTVLTTSDDQARLLLTLRRGGGSLLNAADNAYVLSEMRAVVSYQAWGAGIVRSPRVSVAVKNGWVPLRRDGLWRVNTLGIVRGDGRDYVIAAYENGLGSMQTGVNHKNSVCRAVHASLAHRLFVR